MAWEFQGSIGSPLTNLQVGTGADGVGGYSEISFDVPSNAARHASIRSYSDRRDVMFTVSYPASAPNGFSFPNWTRYPGSMNHLTFSGTFAPPTFSGFANESPWIFFDDAYNAFILSPASHFMTASTAWGAKGELASGIAPEITTLPKGFEHRTLMVIENGINRAFDTWGQTLTAMYGKRRPANDRDASLNRIGYWTDNGATYYYHMEGSLSYLQTLAAVKGDFDRLGIGLGYIQLDSWFYPKGPGAAWSNNGEGIYQYVAASPLFTAGLARFQQTVGVPLVTHARWIDPSSPYRKSYKMSGNVVIDPAYWDTVAGYLATSGVGTFEQDWLNDNAHADFNLTDSDAFLDNMAASMASRNLTMQYCMASARHFMQSAKYDNLTTIRTSADRLGRDRWNEFLYASRLASAMGIWPFTDNFLSTETTHMLLAVLSSGPVGIGDAIGSMNAANLLRAVRRDGVIVKPDVPLTPTNASYVSMAHGADVPQIAATYSDFGALRTNYVFAFTHGANGQVQIRPSELGAEGTVYVYDYFSGKGRLAEASEVFETQIAADSLYLVLAPVGPSGLAMLGDANQFVGMGKKRVPEFTDDGTVHLTLSFADGETQRVIRGYSPGPVAVASVEGAIGRTTYDVATRLFQVAVMPGSSGKASIRIRRGRTAGAGRVSGPPR
jgi:hypothetical protein